MKVFRITTFLDFGGVEKRFVNIASAPAGDELIFVALGHGGWAENEIRNLNRRVICLGARVRIPNLFLIAKLVRLFKREVPDVVHTSGGEANFHGLIAARIAGVPIRVGEEIGFPRHGFLFRKIFKATYSAAHRVVCISEAVKEKVISLGECSAQKLVVVYNPLQDTSVRFSASTQTAVRLVTVSRLFVIKNLDALLRVANALRKKYEFTLTIVGDGPERSKLEALTSSLELNTHVSFVGFQKDPLPFIASSDLFVLVSFSEGLSNSILESMSVGVPCVATKVGGPSEIISHGEDGWLVDPLDEKDIADKLETVLSLTPEQRQQIGHRAMESVRNKFSIARHMASLSQVYKMVATR